MNQRTNEFKLSLLFSTSLFSPHALAMFPVSRLVQHNLETDQLCPLSGLKFSCTSTTHLSIYLRISNTVIANLKINDIEIPKQKEWGPANVQLPTWVSSHCCSSILSWVPISSFSYFPKNQFQTYLADYITSIERSLG